MTEIAAGLSRTEELRVHRRRVRVRVEGAGTPLLLLNGLGRPLESWDPFTQALQGRTDSHAVGRTVVSFDAPGVGASPAPMLPLSIPMLADIAAAVLDVVDLDGADLDGADVLGFSYGGAVAQQLAATHPAVVRRLVLVSTSCGIGSTPAGQMAIDAFRRGLPGVRGRPRPDTIGVLWQSLAIASWSSIPLLGSIRAPTLIVCGNRDGIVPPSNSKLLAQRIPAASLVMLEADHDLQLPGPARQLASTVDRFLRTVAARPSEG